MTGKIAAKKPFMKDLFSLLQDFSVEGKMELSADGLKVNQLGAAQVSALALTVDTDVFEEYESFDSPVYASWSNIESTLKRFKKSSVITLEFDGDDVELYSDRKSFTKPLLDIRVDELKEMPSPDDDKITFELDNIQEAVDDALNVTEQSMTFHFTDAVIAEAEEHRSSYRQVLQKRDKDTQYKVQFGLDFISNAIKPISNMFDEATFCFGQKEGTPLVIEASDEGIELEYLLAPRVNQS